MIKNEYLWVEKYRPQTVSEMILPQEIKKIFMGFVQSGQIPNLILSGSSGIGKTTVAKAMVNEIGSDWYMINGSLDRNIDTLRNEIKDFASTVSFKGGRKYVILDEGDNLNPESTQKALRNFMEEFSNNCGFIFTCNYKNKIIPSLHSRCSLIDFDIPIQEKEELAYLFYKRIVKILNTEKVLYDDSVLAEIIMRYFPDYRRILNELQSYSANGSIDSGIFAFIKETNYSDLIRYLKEKNFTDVRRWIGENNNNNFSTFYNHFYENCEKYFKPSSIPSLILILSKYQYQSAFVASQEINMASCMIEIMSECVFN